MAIKTIYSEETTVEKAIKEIKDKYENISINPSFILYFASSNYDPKELTKGVSNLFDGIKTAGCTTAGEIISGKLLKKSIVLMLFDENSIDSIEYEVVENVGETENIDNAFRAIGKKMNKPVGELEFSDYIGLILIDGLSGSEERVMERIGQLTDIIFIGGSAGDDLKFKETNVFADGKCYTNAALLAVLKPKNGYEIVKTQSFELLDAELTATKVNEEAREVIEFDNKPAVTAYAEALKVSEEKLADYFMLNPLGLMLGGEPYVRSPQQITGSSVKFYCQIKEGMRLSLLRSLDIVDDTKRAIDSILN